MATKINSDLAPFGRVTRLNETSLSASAWMYVDDKPKITSQAGVGTEAEGQEWVTWTLAVQGIHPALSAPSPNMKMLFRKYDGEDYTEK